MDNLIKKSLETKEEIESDQLEQENSSVKAITIQDAMDSVVKLRRFFVERSDVSQINFKKLREIENVVFEIKEKKLKQKKLSEMGFFTFK